MGFSIASCFAYVLVCSFWVSNSKQSSEGEMQKIEISNELLNEEKTVIEDLIVAAHNNAKSKIKSKTAEEISKAAGGLGIPGFKWPL